MRSIRPHLTDVVCWALALPFLAWALLWLSRQQPGVIWTQLVAFTPYVALVSLAACVPALLMKRWWPGGAGLLAALILVAAVIPRALPSTNPGARGPAVRVLSANLFLGKVPPRHIVDLVRRQRVDVLSLQELTPAADSALQNAGLSQLLPHRASQPTEGTDGIAIYSKHPIASWRPIGDQRSLHTSLALPGSSPVEVVAVHPCAPYDSAAERCWAEGLDDLPRADSRGLRILAGDFNATLDHPPLRRLLGTGYRDAAKVTANGFDSTWPAAGHRFTPPVTIDHVLADERVAIRGFRTHDLPRSDHRAVFADLVLPR